MIVVRVELHSAVSGQVTELARMIVCNTGAGSRTVGDYGARVLRGRSKAMLDRGFVQHSGQVVGHPRLRLHVWHLVQKALSSMGYGQ